MFINANYLNKKMREIINIVLYNKWNPDYLDNEQMTITKFKGFKIYYITWYFKDKRLDYHVYDNNKFQRTKEYYEEYDFNKDKKYLLNWDFEKAINDYLKKIG